MAKSLTSMIKPKKSSNEMKVFLTFKESERWLWEALNEKSCKSGFIKDVLKEHFTKKQIPDDDNCIFPSF